MTARIFLYCILLSCLSLSLQAQQQQKVLRVLDSIAISYTEAGRGKETLILLHGLGGTRDHWMRNLPGLSQHYRVLALDLPGYGQSQLQQLPEENLLLFFSKAVVALMDSLSVQKAHLVGHSMGGQLALLLALEQPQRVSSLVLAAPAGIETFTTQEATGLKAYAAASFQQKQSEEQIRQSWAMNFSAMPAETEPLIRARLALNEYDYYPTYAQVLQAGVSGMLEAPVASRLGEIKMPALIVFGAEDKLIPNRYLHPGLTTEAIAQQAQTVIPDSQLVLLPAAGHLLQFEQPEAFNKALLQFLKLNSTTKKSTP
ncbi:alpha/beta hydrolase fold containing protein [Flammeovirgaceae bacterium 311]|nr:alpha/beta hydrolase fold containing protein [Flammeovirgaceae bacterium 311]